MRRLSRRALATTSLMVALAIGLSACGGGSKAAPSPTPKPSPISLGSGNPFDDLRTAAAHMPTTADVLAAGLPVGGKSTSPPAGPTTPPSAGATAAPATGPDSAAAALRAKLTHLLTEHVWLAGLAVATAYHFGAESPQFGLAAATVDKNSVDVAEVVGGVAPDQKASFLQAWRSHVTDLVNYAKGAKAGGSNGDKMKQDADANLLAYARSQGEFFAKITNGALSADVVRQSLTTHISLLAGAVDALAASSNDAFKKLKQAAAHMPDMAATLTSGVAKSANIPGDSADKASVLRSNLTGLLTSHVYLTGVAVFTAYSMPGGTDAPAFKAATDALDTNSQDLATTVGRVDRGKQDAFLQLWRSQISDLVVYTKAAANSDAAGKARAMSNLDSYRASAGKFFADLSGGALNADAVAASLREGVDSLTAAIDSLKSAVLNVPVTVPTSAPTVSAAPTPSESASPTATSRTRKTNTPTPSLSPSARASASASASVSASSSP